MKPKLTPAANSIVQMISCLMEEAGGVRLCVNCSKNYGNIVDHCISESTYGHQDRVSLLV